MTPQQVSIFEKEIGGRKLIVEVGLLAMQANGSCTVQYGDTKVLATVVISKTPRENTDFFPLLVDFEERLYAAGKIKGSRFIKREGRPSDEATLSARLIDRSIRPLFDESIRNDIQVVLTVLSVDGENDSEFPAVIASSCALALSDIPWNGPIGAINIGHVNNELIINPTTIQKEQGDMEIFVTGVQHGKITMIESLAFEIDEEVFLKCLKLAQTTIAEILDFITHIQTTAGKPKIIPDVATVTEEERQKKEALQNRVELFAKEQLHAFWGIREKKSREQKITQIYDLLDETLKQETFDEGARKDAQKILLSLMEKESRRIVLQEKRRVDGRKPDEVRALSCSVGLLPRTHGTGLFNRGETQVLSIVTLGAPGDEQLLDGMENTGVKRYMHHYNFPGFSVGEVKPTRFPSRREVGHGALAEKALLPVLPKKEEFPYTIRVVSEVLSSNGSTSQASICGSSLALMDAGVPISSPVAGIAMGLVTDPKNEKIYEILTDIQGIEDHSGDMDFKVAGTRRGMTAVQLDVKVHGISVEICQKTLEQAKNARLQILDVLEQSISEPRKELSRYAPRIFTLKVDPSQIGEVIGRGGETINHIVEECGGRDVCKIDIEEDGLIMITTRDATNGMKAKTLIENLTREIQEGEIYEGVVTRIVKDRNTGKEIGAIVEIVPGQDGMVHISEFAHRKIPNVSDVVNINDKLFVKVIEIDKERGRITLSHKATLNGQNNTQNMQEKRENFPPKKMKRA